MFEEFLCVGEAACGAIVVLADEDRAALRIREPTNPFEVFVLPRAFPLDVLLFGHCAEFKNAMLNKFALWSTQEWSP